MSNPMKGWRLVSLYTETYPNNPKKPIYVSFAHYTGHYANGGGLEYDKTLKGNLSFEQLRRSLKKYLQLSSGNALEGRR